MAYAKEFDELRQEIRRNVAGTISFWPKVNGTGNVTASATASHNTFRVLDDDGNEIQSATNCTVTTVGSVSRLDCAVSAISELDEYFVEVSWRLSGASSTTGVKRVPFSVVLYPYSTTEVSLNDLVTLSDQADVICKRIGVKRGISASSAAEEMASVFGYEGRCALEEKLRNVIAGGSVTPRPGTVADMQWGSVLEWVRPRLVLDSERLLRVERYLAAAAMFQADMSGVEGEQSERMAAYFNEKAESAFRALGQLRYDGLETGGESSVIEEPGRVVRVRRG